MIDRILLTICLLFIIYSAVCARAEVLNTLQVIEVIAAAAILFFGATMERNK